MICVEDIIKKVIQRHPCCEIWTIPFSLLEIQEKEFFNEFSSTFETAIVLGHHIVTKDEWKWFTDENDQEYCNADSHTKNVCEQLNKELEIYGFQTKIVPYPGESGLRFRFVAQAAGAGEIGINAFLLHPEWGPWIHLRILITNASSMIISILHKQVCNACNICIFECPSDAIQVNSFDGLLCRNYRKAKGEYVPYGPERELKYCTNCADVCPIGQKPI
jgi:epoxyqueuosine reductase